RGRAEDVDATGLQHRSPRLTWKRRPERADALGRDDRDAPRLAREGEELLVAGRVALSDGGKRMVLVAQEEDLAEVPAGPRLDLRDPAEHGALEVELHEGAD